jgi:hypothetical protein
MIISVRMWRITKKLRKLTSFFYMNLSVERNNITQSTVLRRSFKVVDIYSSEK